MSGQHLIARGYQFDQCGDAALEVGMDLAGPLQDGARLAHPTIESNQGAQRIDML